jgi:hypothetical protein
MAISEMVERVAKAIYTKFEDRPVYAQAQMNGVLAEELARAAIEAMREPPEKMQQVAWMTADESVIHWWHVMIDAAVGTPE